MRSECLRLGAAACVLAATACASVAVADEDASAWDGDPRSSVRLIAGSANGSAHVRAGLEIRLKPGWHTYWRYPGDSGVPPQFDFRGSQNLQAVTVLWPAPRRIAEQRLSSIGYTTDVLLPLSIVPQTDKAQITLRLSVNYAICDNLCVPAQGNVQLALANRPSSQDPLLAGAEARVPKKRAIGEGSGLSIRSIHREGHLPRSRAVIDVEAPSGTAVDLFVEGPTPDWALPVPVELGTSDNGLRRFAFDLDGAPPGAKYEGALITITAVAAHDAIEVNAPLD